MTGIGLIDPSVEQFIENGIPLATMPFDAVEVTVILLAEGGTAIQMN